MTPRETVLLRGCGPGPGDPHLPCGPDDGQNAERHHDGKEGDQRQSDTSQPIPDESTSTQALEQQTREIMLKGKPPPKRPTGKGFLQITDKWQDPYISGEKGKELAYFLR